MRVRSARGALARVALVLVAALAALGVWAAASVRDDEAVSSSAGPAASPGRGVGVDLADVRLTSDERTSGTAAQRGLHVPVLVALAAVSAALVGPRGRRVAALSSPLRVSQFSAFPQRGRAPPVPRPLTV